jgi:hypothetical protein
MSIINIIIVIILVLVVLWVLSNTIFKGNILYDRMCEASKTAKISATGESNDNVIPNGSIPGSASANFMLSVWFYIDNWGNNISKEKNILFMANNPTAYTVPALQNSLSGLSTKAILSAPAPPTPKNINIALDKYENNLFIDIECLPDKAGDGNKTYFTRYKIPNIPVQKWNNLTISVDTRTLDVYLDGKLRNSFIMHGLYKNDTNALNNIYLGNINSSNLGFQGFITRVRFSGESCNPQDAYNIYREGINASLAKSLFNKYRLKVSFLEYNTEKASFQI